MTIMPNDGCKHTFSMVKDQNVCAFPRPGQGTCGVSIFFHELSKVNDPTHLKKNKQLVWMLA